MTDDRPTGEERRTARADTIEYTPRDALARP